MDLAPTFVEDLGLCPFALLVGKPCILCGGTRAMVALATGNLDRAWSLNASVVLLCSVTPLVIAAQWTVWRSSLVLRYRAGLAWIQSGTWRPNAVLAGVFVIWWTWNVLRW